MRLEGSIKIDRAITEVFDFVADPQNDPVWCERVKWCRQVRGSGPEIEASYKALHKPSGYPWAHIRRIELLAFEHPHLVTWEQRDQLARVCNHLRARSGVRRDAAHPAG